MQCPKCSKLMNSEGQKQDDTDGSCWLTYNCGMCKHTHRVCLSKGLKKEEENVQTNSYR